MKVFKVLEHFEVTLNRHFDAINLSREDNIAFIYERLADYGQFMSRENFQIFLNNLGFQMNHDGFPIRRHLEDAEIQYFIRELRNPTQHERNLFILYQLFTLTRRLVQMFVYDGFAASYLNFFAESE
ncbi:unnamed protein product [Meloidogyne enterolobii]|uniref:Uncharacterized protein n=1 Tax=Meloidogyne enterolobii TaxID=390850 RepID=A0ACB1A792_MELEN